MVKLVNPKKIIENNKEYAIYELKVNSVKFPLIIDWDIHSEIEDLNKSWHVNDNGSVVCNHKFNGKIYEFNIHDVVLKLNNIEKETPILHINKLGIDNRLENLMYNDKTKEIKRNLKKKARTIKLSRTIDVKNIPSFIWYMHADKSHGERFVVCFGDINWKSTSSNKLSLNYKLEQTKQYLRYLKESQPEMFAKFSMNGDLNKQGQQSLNLFFKIAHKAGFEHLTSIQQNKNTDKYLTEDLTNLSEQEITLLHSSEYFS